MSGEVLPVVGADHANGVTVLGNSGVEQVELVLYFLNTAILYTKRFVTALSEETLLENRERLAVFAAGQTEVGVGSQVGFTLVDDTAWIGIVEFRVLFVKGQDFRLAVIQYGQRNDAVLLFRPFGHAQE
ncbi:MAG: hypothetical protein O6918_03350 [Deltaproteobacteria bacterium]|nr:hypothetical protein [Deltaproteobacteria bacterium]